MQQRALSAMQQASPRPQSQPQPRRQESRLTLSGLTATSRFAADLRARASPRPLAAVMNTPMGPTYSPPLPDAVPPESPPPAERSVAPLDKPTRRPRTPTSVGHASLFASRAGAAQRAVPPESLGPPPSERPVAPPRPPAGAPPAAAYRQDSSAGVAPPRMPSPRMPPPPPSPGRNASQVIAPPDCDQAKNSDVMSGRRLVALRAAVVWNTARARKSAWPRAPRRLALSTRNDQE